MHPIFQISYSDIQALNDSQARELLARLCKAELRAKGLGTSFVTWGGDQRARDGGVDVRVDITPVFGISGYIPNDSTAYQVKAESFNSAKIPSEMAPKGAIRNAISEFGARSGAYIIVSTKDNLSDSSLRARKKAMANCLAAYGLAEKVHLDFFDCRKVADWVENYPALVIWLRSTLGRPLQGWQSYGPWAYFETNAEEEYFLDDKVKVQVPESQDGIDIHNAINRLRGELQMNGASARVVGLSGVGKTRFVQALFDNRIVTSNDELDLQNVLYTDLSHNPTPQPLAMLEALNLAGSDSVVVVDNCGQDVHRQLTELVKKTDSKLRLVTVEYDIRDDLPEGTSCYHLEGASNEVIVKLLKRRYRTLSDLDVNKIVEFSDGNARVAFALASTSESKGELNQLTDDALFQRLFLQKHSVNDELLKCAEVASLLYSFNTEDTSEKPEINILAGLVEVPTQTFFRHVVELQRRGLVQERGKWRAVLPHAISNRLALRAVQAYQPSVLIQKLVAESSERVARSFSRRLGFLHESRYARSIAQEWLSPTGILGDVAGLDEIKRQMFENIAPLDPRSALDAILRAINCGDFTSPSNQSRKRFADLLRSLAYEHDLFEDAANALLLFALKEPEGYRSDSIRDTLKSLFFIYLSGTQALPTQRATFVRTLGLSANEERQRLALVLLGAGLATHHFSSHHRFDFGARKRSYGWHPKTQQELRDWYALFIDIATELGQVSTRIGMEARNLLGASFRGLWVGGLHTELSTAGRALALIDGWPAGWIGARNTLHWDKSKIDPNSYAALVTLEKTLVPRDLKSRINARVLTRGDFATDIDDENPNQTAADRYHRAQEEVQELGKLAALDATITANLAPYISIKEINEKAWSFGLGMGQAAISCTELLGQLKTLIAKMEPEKANSNFIRGLVSGWGRVNLEELNSFLDSAVDDEVWGQMFPELQLSIALDNAAHARLLRSLTVDIAPSWQYRGLGYGRATDPLTVDQIASLLTALATKEDDGLLAAIDTLDMVVHCSDTKDERYRSDLRDFCINFVGSLGWDRIDLDNDNLVHRIVGIVEFSLVGLSSNALASSTVIRLIELERNKIQRVPNRIGSILVPFFKMCPLESLGASYFRDSDGSTRTALRILSVRLDRHGDFAVGSAPEAALIDWCRLSPEDHFIFAAETCKLFERSSPNDEDVTGITSTALTILRLAPDKEEIFDIFLRRFYPTSWSGSLASILRQRLRLLDQFKSIEDVPLHALIEAAQSRFLVALANEEKREDVEERSRTSSFE